MAMSSSDVSAAAPIQQVTGIDRVIGAGAIVALAAIIAAVLRGRGEWGTIAPAVWAHLLTVSLAVALTPVMLWRPRGDRRHRQLGYVWVSAMTLTALASLGVRGINHGHFSPIHLLSILTLLCLPIIVTSARRHDHLLHAKAIRGMALGALLVSGSLTFLPARLLGHWLLG